jgi:hypothetical protein
MPPRGLELGDHLPALLDVATYAAAARHDALFPEGDGVEFKIAGGPACQDKLEVDVAGGFALLKLGKRTVPPGLPFGF